MFVIKNLPIIFPGNYEGKGQTRRKELWQACHELGVEEHNICLVNDTRLPDDPKAQWPVAVVAKLLTHHVEMLDVDTLVTFDRGGVSSHKNHSAVFYAVAYMFVEKLMPQSELAVVIIRFPVRPYFFFIKCLLSFCLTISFVLKMMIMSV